MSKEPSATLVLGGMVDRSTRWVCSSHIYDAPYGERQTASHTQAWGRRRTKENKQRRSGRQASTRTPGSSDTKCPHVFCEYTGFTSHMILCCIPVPGAGFYARAAQDGQWREDARQVVKCKGCEEQITASRGPKRAHWTRPKKDASLLCVCMEVSQWWCTSKRSRHFSSHKASRRTE